MKNFFKIKLYLIVIALAGMFGCSMQPSKDSVALSSPDSKNKVEFSLNELGAPYYTVSRNDETLVSKSRMGFIFKGNDHFDCNFSILNVTKSAHNDTWQPVVGEYKEIRNNYNELTVELQEQEGKKRKLNVTFRLYNDGLGFRYEIPKQDNITNIEIASEETEFAIAKETTAWWIPGDYNSYENIYNETEVCKIDSANTPVTLKTLQGTHLSIHEANLTDYSDMTLKVNQKGTLYCNLVPWPDGIKVKGVAPMNTPWRTLQIGEDAGDLIESSLILNLNEPNRIEDTSWIKPMKYTGIWWTVHLGFETFEVGEHHAGTTEKTKRMIDYASKLGIKGLLIEGWNKGWDLRGKSKEIPDFLHGAEDYDLKALVEYAKSKGVELIVHHETFGNIAHYEKYMEPSFKMIHDLGLSSVKGGYAGSIKPAVQQKHGQWMVRHYRKQLEMAAKYGIMLDIHEPIKQTGLRRTYPNLMTVEGVRGMEFAAWSEGNPPSHTLMVPFTRMLAGPVDYNAGIFDIKYESLKKHKFNWRMPKKKYPKNPGPCVKTTLAKQLALHVVLFSPMQMSPDLPENYDGHPAFKFLQDVAVVWDDTKVLNGEVGDYITMARKAKDSDDWFIGSMTNEEARTFEVDLDFLDEGIKYQATVYADAADAHWDKNPTAYSISHQEVNRNSKLTVKLVPGGGQAIRITPLQ
ncbi:glycoside hydrolase family 97 protein [Puteibacter caeruleilacunae]|nr:glycoside hydrolase family 97 protein [Puteibacter caeruleilacunae]